MGFNYISFLQNKKGIIFDCDGVIINSKEANVRFYNLILEKLNLPPMDKSQEEYVHSHTVYESIKKIVPKELLDRAFQIGRKISYMEVIPLIQLEDGLLEFLDVLKARNKKCAINTNRTNTMPMIMDIFKLSEYFEPVVTADVVENPKPHPESIFYILKEWEIDPTDVVFIGDSKVDELTAKNVPVDFISYKNQKLDAIVCISSYKDIVKSLKK